jgi:hypothetical protein
MPVCMERQAGGAAAPALLRRTHARAPAQRTSMAERVPNPNCGAGPPNRTGRSPLNALSHWHVPRAHLQCADVYKGPAGAHRSWSCGWLWSNAARSRVQPLSAATEKALRPIKAHGCRRAPQRPAAGVTDAERWQETCRCLLLEGCLSMGWHKMVSRNTMDAMGRAGLLKGPRATRLLFLTQKPA